MRDIKERVRDKNPKIRNPASERAGSSDGTGGKRKAKGTTGKNWQPIRIPDTVWC
mgnify:CR=1 FL=1